MIERLKFDFESVFSNDLSEVEIVVGTNHWRSGVHYKPEKFIAHKSFDNPSFAYDIGLIRAQTPIEFSEKVQPIKLSPNVVEAGSNLLVTGWGRLGVSHVFFNISRSEMG